MSTQDYSSRSPFRESLQYLSDALRSAMSRLKTLPLPVQQLPSNHAEILATAKHHFLEASEVSLDGLPAFGVRWDTYRRSMRDRIMSFASLADAIAFGQGLQAFDHRARVRSARIDQTNIAEHLLGYEFQQFKRVIADSEDSPASTTGTTYRRTSGRLTSNILYFHLLHVLTSLTIDRNISSVCELGGGYGNIAWLWLKNPVSKVDVYGIVDIAESQFFAECFVRASLPDIEVVHISTPDTPIPVKATHPRLIVCPVQCARAMTTVPFDLLTNTASLGEMTDEWVKYWADWIEDLDAKFFYSHNYFGNPVESVYEARSACAPLPMSSWALRYTRPMPPLMMLYSSDRRSMEMVFEKERGCGRGDFAAYARGTAGMRLGLADLARLIYSKWEVDDIVSIVSLVDRLRVDFGYDPVELVHICRRICESDGLAKLPVVEQQRLARLSDEMVQRYRRHYPAGVNAE